MVDVTIIDDGELLYRRVNRDISKYHDGAWKLTSEAFNDRSWKPSVDRNSIHPDAAMVKFLPTDGVVHVIANEVRAIAGIAVNPSPAQGELLQYHKIDVLHRPVNVPNPDGLPENPAHSQIEANPNYANKSRWNKLKDALCRLAEKRGWVIEPTPDDPAAG